MAKHHSGSFFNGILLGSTVGAVVGLLVAPRTGKETRRILKKSAEALPELAEDLSSTLNLHTHNLSHTARQRWQETLERLQTAIAAGVEVSQATTADLNHKPEAAAETQPLSERAS
ncbi:MAG: YtxH domain-containing protein [Spirulina sp. SIO3F2]|nr:YtxH domain-containing protein [Spirulina sp. SIO3F2]